MWSFIEEMKPWGRADGKSRGVLFLVGWIIVETEDLYPINTTLTLAIAIASLPSFILSVANTSKPAISCLGSVGLLGEYCPCSRIKIRPLSDRISCMHLVSFQEYPEKFYGCSWLRPFLTAEDQSSLVQEALEGNSAAAHAWTASIYSF
ncbi:hypothetical protein Patl1_21379 [Pistacia atlantica]|uniref:Uncharacterized protein n=1 Tax=Pistacia atlantica TaxID=434234 RepID=A0ACC1BLW8_9ROSI|nr:hypothetical protein Patl1_21379 [Pistacia atlantica]